MTTTEERKAEGPGEGSPGAGGTAGSGARPVRRQSIVGRVVAAIRNTWRGLTSMRTALVLLFLLALAAIPGALIPQRSLNAAKVDQYISDHPTIGPILDKLQVYNVFGSFWFTAIYALLFISLIGCVTPRCIDLAKSLRAKPVPAPRNLRRLPHHFRESFDGDVEQQAQRVRGMLRGWRTATRTGDDGSVTISAERGYLREFGNLVFHFSLVGLLIAIAMGKMFDYEGNVIVVADGGPGICNTSPSVYDSFRAGLSENGTGLTPFCVRVDNFNAEYLPTGEAKSFNSDIEYQTAKELRAGSDTWHHYDLQVNKPLRVDGDRVYLQGHGYAPTFTVTFPDGEKRTQTLQFRPDDVHNFLSTGAMRFDPPAGMYPDPSVRRKNQIAIQGLFAPTAQMQGKLLSSSSPEMHDPAVAIDIYKGDTGLDSGMAQSIFSLDPQMIAQGRLVKKDRVNLKPGQSATLADGTKVQFDGAQEFVNLQVSHDPAQDWVLVFAVTMIGGLLVSLLVKRRRVWARIAPAESGAGDGPDDDQRRTVVELGGLARTDHAGWGDEFTKLCARLREGAADTGGPGTGSADKPSRA